MKGFKEFLKESANMSVSSAMAILGLSGTFSMDELKKAYKVASNKNHPDKGGDVEAMKDVNVAYEKLKPQVGKASTGDVTSSSSYQSYQEREAWWKSILREVQAELKQKYQPDEFIKYFEKNFNQTFTATTTWQPESSTWTGFRTDFSNKDKSISFEFSISVYGANVVNTQRSMALTGDANISYPLGVIAYGYANLKKEKMAQKDFNNNENHIVLSKPETTFPLAKIKKMAKGGEVAQDKKMSKASFQLALEKTVGATRFNVGIYQIELQDGLALLTRNSFKGDAYWQVHLGVKKGYSFNRTSMVSHIIGENPKAISDLNTMKVMTLSGAEEFLKSIKD